MIYNFPRTRFVTENGIVGQTEHIVREANEVEDSLLFPDIFHTAVEIMDCLHACESGLRILEEKYGVDVEDVACYVLAKNKARNYYECFGGKTEIKEGV